MRFLSNKITLQKQFIRYILCRPTVKVPEREQDASVLIHESCWCGVIELSFFVLCHALFCAFHFIPLNSQPCTCAYQGPFSTKIRGQLRDTNHDNSCSVDVQTPCPKYGRAQSLYPSCVTRTLTQPPSPKAPTLDGRQKTCKCLWYG